jgi:hypothetical protein
MWYARSAIISSVTADAVPVLARVEVVLRVFLGAAAAAFFSFAAIRVLLLGTAEMPRRSSGIDLSARSPPVACCGSCRS